MKIVIETTREEVEAALEVLDNTINRDPNERFINRDPNERFWSFLQAAAPSIVTAFSEYIARKERERKSPPPKDPEETGGQAL